MNTPLASGPANASTHPYAAPRAYVPGAKRLRVLLISHTCQSRTEGQPKAHALARLPEVDLHLLTPNRWMHYGAWRDAQPPVASPDSAAFQCTIAPIRFAWMGPAQSFLHYYPGLPDLLRTFKPDVMDIWEEPWSYVSAHACRWRKKLLPACKIISETEQNILKKLPPPFEQFRRYTLRHADYVVARNREAVDVVRAKGFTGRAEVVPNAVDTQLFRPLDRDACRRKVLKDMGMPDASAHRSLFLAGYAGRLVEEKGLLDLVQALSKVPENVHLLLLGGGPFESELRASARDMGLGPRVHFLPARPLEELPEIMNALDVFVLPSRTTPSWKEQFGRVIIEAHACGTPVIGSDSGAIPDVIADAGLVVAERNPQAIAQALSTLAADPALARRMGGIGLQNARDLYTWDRVAQRMASIYQVV